MKQQISIKLEPETLQLLDKYTELQGIKKGRNALLEHIAGDYLTNKDNFLCCPYCNEPQTFATIQLPDGFTLCRDCKKDIAVKEGVFYKLEQKG